MPPPKAKPAPKPAPKSAPKSALKTASKTVSKGRSEASLVPQVYALRQHFISGQAYTFLIEGSRLNFATSVTIGDPAADWDPSDFAEGQFWVAPDGTSLSITSTPTAYAPSTFEEPSGVIRRLYAGDGTVTITITFNPDGPIWKLYLTYPSSYD